MGCEGRQLEQCPNCTGNRVQCSLSRKYKLGEIRLEADCGDPV